MSALPAPPGEPHGLSSETLWQTELVVALPPRHPLLVHKRVPLAELASCPLVLFHPEVQGGLHQQISSVLAGANSSLAVNAMARQSAFVPIRCSAVFRVFSLMLSFGRLR